MIRLTRKTMLALEAVLDIAYNARPEPVQAKDVTERQGIPQRYLEQVLQHLVRRGILRGVRGPRGGYTLGRERRRLSVGEVVRVISEIDHDDAESASKSELCARVVQPLWGDVQDDIFARLDKITLEDLCKQAETAGVPRAGDTPIDFTI